MSDMMTPGMLRDLADLCAGSGRIIHQDIQSVLREDTYGALAQTLRDEAARREAVQEPSPPGWDAPERMALKQPPSADLVARLRKMENLAGLPHPLCVEAAAAIEALRARKKALEGAALRLANAADAVGVEHFDTDTFAPEVLEMQQATIEVRQALAAGGADA